MITADNAKVVAQTLQANDSQFDGLWKDDFSGKYMTAIADNGQFALIGAEGWEPLAVGCSEFEWSTDYDQLPIVARIIATGEIKFFDGLHEVYLYCRKIAAAPSAVDVSTAEVEPVEQIAPSRPKYNFRGYRTIAFGCAGSDAEGCRIIKEFTHKSDALVSAHDQASASCWRSSDCVIVDVVIAQGFAVSGNDGAAGSWVTIELIRLSAMGRKIAQTITCLSGIAFDVDLVWDNPQPIE